MTMGGVWCGKFWVIGQLWKELLFPCGYLSGRAGANGDLTVLVEFAGLIGRGFTLMERGQRRVSQVGAWLYARRVFCCTAMEEEKGERGRAAGKAPGAYVEMK